MFGIGWTELIVIAIIALLFVGPKQLPGMLQKLGRIVAELKSASRELREQLEAETSDIESPRDIVRDLGRELQKDIPSPYADVERADRRLRAALDSASQEVNAELGQPSTEKPKPASDQDDDVPADSGPKTEEAAAAPQEQGLESTAPPGGRGHDPKERDS